ncbi:endo alpha-1,4 polygalactosaminidase [Flavobacterium selenitireducens]|uniref:endo alpha-1,4 polygalactosaminidase n=1 Tax=Flavobacterium selenitireducens TaxID=2722704 RepID=UPI00168AF105|nr:endo alpha-1,4 polygalactosaminidase [Flavobacterium selenitireducens]MBD3581149.1 hypothetical protein [Flavobacterium selenitireducens]
MKRIAASLFISILTIGSCSKKESPTTAHRDEPRNEAEAGLAMQQFVTQISKSAKAMKPGFNIIPQNGADLAYTNLNPRQGKNYQYIQGIDGFGVEELFYTEDGSIDSARVAILSALKNDRKILVSEYIPDTPQINKVAQYNLEAGFVPFIRMKSNYSYSHIPERIRNQNQDDVTEMDQVRNYLYLINPKEFETKEAFLESLSQTNFDLLIIDLFYDQQPLTKSELDRLKTKADGGKRLVVCYVNIGSAEKWRYYWNKSWKIGKPSWLRKKYEGYDEEFYVAFWDPEWKGIVYSGPDSYIRKIIHAGFDGAYLDNTEAYHYLFHEHQE